MTIVPPFGCRVEPLMKLLLIDDGKTVELLLADTGRLLLTTDEKVVMLPVMVGAELVMKVDDETMVPLAGGTVLVLVSALLVC